ncbi:MAG TPA: polysaccharide biosynthesis C-terminal domain-containing protein, partial [Casimicrobiaceae bacterium]|nr:polysaccharide biosynthesis C-terminal domain-containing protein [Casimicrobiaceae bacterium]
AEGRGLLGIGFAGVVTAPMYWMLSSSDRWFLEHYRGGTDVGVYAVGYSIAIVGMLVNAAVMTVWQPEAAREYEEHPARAGATLGRLMSRLSAAMAVMWLAVTAAGGDIVRWLADERFHGAAAYVPWIAGGVFFYGILRLATTGLLLARQLAWSAAWWFAGGVVCVLLNFALVPAFGGAGAAATQVASFAFIAAGTMVTAQRKFPVRLEWGRLAASVALVVGAGLLLAPTWHAHALLSLAMKLPVGMAVAACVARIAAPDWWAWALDRVRNHRRAA